jgi:hypothetical protein
VTKAEGRPAAVPTLEVVPTLDGPLMPCREAYRDLLVSRSPSGSPRWRPGPRWVRHLTHLAAWEADNGQDDRAGRPLGLKRPA